MKDVVSKGRFAYFVSRAIVKDGQYVPCIAFEDEQGYYKTNYLWGDSYYLANKCCDHRNKCLGLTKADSLRIVCSSMREQVGKTK